MTNLPRRIAATTAALALAVASVTVGGMSATAAPAEGSALTNTAHLDYLLDTAAPGEVPGHSTYRIAEEPDLTLPWTYADARDGGTFERVGGGQLDPATGDYTQGAYNSDDVSRTAVVYLRDWQRSGSEESRQKAYEVLRSLAYFQTTDGEDAGNVVLWMQTDGELNPSAEPVELPDPSDSEDSYWLARTLWAFGEGYAAFRDTDPEFAAFLQDRLRLGVSAVDREVLDRYGEYVPADGVQVPAWLIVDGADATAEALLGLSSYVTAAPDDAAVRESTRRLAEGLDAFARTTATDGSAASWPYGAVLPWAESRSMWHAWSSQMTAGLVASSEALGDPALLEPAVVDAARFAPTLLTAGGPDNAWYPTPTERVQIAYGADSQVQNLLRVADATGSSAFTDLAGMQAAWFFGANPAGEAMYDPATGVTFDGIGADGAINRNSGAESTIHGLLSMIALDAHPEVAARATATDVAVSHDGLTVVEAETAVTRGGEVITPESSWTEESSWSGAYLHLGRGDSARFELGRSDAPRLVEPVSWQIEKGTATVPRTLWTSGRQPVGLLTHTVGEQGITAASGALLPQSLQRSVPKGSGELTVRLVTGAVDIDALLVRPAVARLSLGGDATSDLVQNNSRGETDATVVGQGDGMLRSYDRAGTLIEERAVSGDATARLPAGGFAIVER
ncbi:hypothetical protein ACFSBZ_11280 [Amnibacterium flavum]|uniref:D-glucuronyl C5-epimerase C-terminal domain-containing protein n=1 Tax=Amnibacterium flavum TaxID=2173173 RepID=A0A2V1HY94_9MICO|nr:hypothetical protein [Amnibacterium flavum]PVZ95404.1 hypothetical protein DDQ50_02500 [Amnibacterium flavum]